MKRVLSLFMLLCAVCTGAWGHDVYGDPIDVTALSVGEAVTCYVHAGGAANGWLNTTSNNPGASVQEQSAEYMYTITKTEENTYQVMLKNTYWVCFKNTTSTGGWANPTGTGTLYELDLVFEAAVNPTNVLDYGKNAFIIKGKTSGLHNAYQSNRFSATQTLPAVPVQFYAVSNSLVGKWFRMQLRPGATENINYPFYYNEVENKIKTRNSTDANSAIAERVFFFKKSGNWGVTLHTLAIGESKGFTVATPARVDGNDNTTGSMSENPTVFNLVANNNTNGKWALNLPHSTTSYVNDISGNLGAWNHNSARNDGGSAFLIIELTTEEEAVLGKWDGDVDALVAEVEAEIASLHNGTVVGKPNAAEIIALASAKEVAKNATPKYKSTYQNLLDAFNDFKCSSNICLPKDGHAYVFTNIATDKSKHYLYEDTKSDKVLWAERGQGSAESLPANGKYICRVNGDYFTFVNAESGHYLIWRGSNAGYNSTKGYVDEYNSEYAKLKVERAEYSNNYMGNATGQTDLFGWVCICGMRPSYSGIDKCFLYSNGTDHFNQDTTYAQRFGDGHSSMFAIEEASFPYTTKTLYDGGDGKNYATVALPYAMEIPADVKAYAAVAEGDVLTLTDVTESSQNVPAGAYILVSESKTSAAVLPAAANPDAVDNELQGSITTAPSGDIYVLNKVDGVGFYKFNGNYDTLLGKAYLPSSAKVSKFSFNFGEETTAISAVESERSNAEIYDLSGRKITRTQKGINIINGHKVIK